jgi:CRP/FNR family cyclic AMP-dependent transcriptional regulator
MLPRGGNEVGRWAPGSLLDSLTPSQRRVVLGLGRARQYNTGDTLLNQGDRSDYLVIIVDGYVKISAVTAGGAESLLAIRAAGDVIGELAAIDGLPRSATARAADAVIARFVTKQEIDRCLRDHPDISRAFNQAVGTKLRLATQRRVDFRRDTKTRLAQVLVDLYYGSPGRRGDGTMSVLVTQSELAGLIGASEPAVHKALKTLRDAQAIGTGYGRLVIQDIAAVRQIAEGRA